MPGPLSSYPWYELWHPEVVAAMLLVAQVYRLIVGPLRERYGWGEPVTRRQRLWFYLGLLTVYLAEGTPLHVLSEVFLFSAHMVQHSLLTLLAPIFVLYGIPEWLMRLILRPRPLALLGRVLINPLAGIVLFNLIYALWHLPALYQAALYMHGIHVLEHALLVPTALLMWMPIFSPMPEHRIGDAAKLLYLFILAAAQLAVFGFITYSDHVVYPRYAEAPRIWGIDPMVDQQLSGIVMKLGGMAVFLVALFVIFFRWARREERRSAFEAQNVPRQLETQ